MMELMRVPCRRFRAMVLSGQSMLAKFRRGGTDHAKLEKAWRWRSIMLLAASPGLVVLGSLNEGCVGRPAPQSASDEPGSFFRSCSLDDWHPPTGDWQVVGEVELDYADPRRFRARPGEGVLWNGPQGRTVHLVSRAEFGDAVIRLEFCLPRRSNSGVYVMGRYEIQIYDSFGVTRDKYPGIECGGIYPRWVNNREVEGHSPRVNASRPPGEWQSFEILFRAPRFDPAGRKVENARFVRVIHNGIVVHENVEVHGPTRSALFEDEQSRGPLMLQGDHGPVAFRNIFVRPLWLP